MIRNDIAHEGGIASAATIAACAVFADWLKVGEPIRITPTEVARFMIEIGIEDPRIWLLPRPSLRELLAKRGV